MKFRLVVEFDERVGRWSAVFPEIPGCATAGDTEEEAIKNAQEALDLWFEPTEQEFSPNARILELSVA
jgi:predicted RNase H-like HicB family nuclease